MPYRKLLLALSFWYVLSGILVAWLMAQSHPPLVHIHECRVQRSFQSDPWPDVFWEARQTGDFFTSSRVILTRHFGREFLVFSAIPSTAFPPWALYRTHVVAWNAGLNLAHVRAFSGAGILVSTLIIAGPEKLLMHGLLLFGALNIVLMTAFPAASGFTSRKAAYLSGLRELGLIIAVCAAISVVAALFQSLLLTSLYAGWNPA